VLLEPYRFKNGVQAKNRVWLAPLTNLQSLPDGTISDDELRWLARRAEGGFGVVETCAAYVAENGKGWPGELGVHDDTMQPGLARLAQALRGSLGVVQLFHGGMRADAAINGGVAYGPDDVSEAWIEDVIGRFRDAAMRCVRAGFAGVELHGAHGYLLGQFLSSVNNTRTDRWGGPFENRARLVREVLKAVRAAVPPSFLVGVRLSPEDYGNSVGLDLDESLGLAGWLADDGADFVHVSLWDVWRTTKKRPGQHPVPLFRSAIPADVALVVAGKVWTREEAERLLAMGADAVALGRSAIANPSWPRDAADPAWVPKRPPLTRAELAERAVSDTFVTYLSRFKGMVAEPEA